ncbi:hypothetical protein V8C86DRAFT_3125725 [Haematococcus lacustris]
MEQQNTGSKSTSDVDSSQYNEQERVSTHDRASTSGLNAAWQSILASEAAYVIASSGTILFNKHALSSFGTLPAPNTLLLFQFGLAVFLLKSMEVLGFIQLQPLRLDKVKLWLPVNLIFVAMNVTGFYALQSIGAGMFTVLKNLSNLMTIGGDYLLYGNTYPWQVWSCLGLMVLSALFGGWTDLTFSVRGYAWQLVNCLFTAAYSLYLSGVIRRVSGPQDKHPLNELSMVYYNNVLSIPPLALLSLVTREPWRLRGYTHLTSWEFQLVAVLGALMGFAVSFASIWCMSRTSATIYSLTGSLNKVVVALVGIWWFREPTTLYNLCSISAGLAAGFLFVLAKSAHATNSQQPPSPALKQSRGLLHSGSLLVLSSLIGGSSRAAQSDEEQGAGMTKKLSDPALPLLANGHTSHPSVGSPSANGGAGEGAAANAAGSPSNVEGPSKAVGRAGSRGLMSGSVTASGLHPTNSGMQQVSIAVQSVGGNHPRGVRLT